MQARPGRALGPERVLRPCRSPLSPRVPPPRRVTPGARSKLNALESGAGASLPVLSLPEASRRRVPEEAAGAGSICQQRSGALALVGKLAKVSGPPKRPS